MPMGRIGQAVFRDTPTPTPTLAPCLSPYMPPPFLLSFDQYLMKAVMLHACGILLFVQIEHRRKWCAMVAWQ